MLSYFKIYFLKSAHALNRINACVYSNSKTCTCSRLNPINIFFPLFYLCSMVLYQYIQVLAFSNIFNNFKDICFKIGLDVVNFSLVTGCIIVNLKVLP